jgi:hypothetical protein
MVGIGECNNTNEPCVPRPRVASQSLQELFRAFLLGWAKAGGPDPGEAAQRIHLNAGVVAQRGQTRPGHGRLGLEPRILLVGLPHLLDLGVECDQLDAGSGQKLTIFAKLAGVS